MEVLLREFFPVDVPVDNSETGRRVVGKEVRVGNFC